MPQTFDMGHTALLLSEGRHAEDFPHEKSDGFGRV
jgi:hypothetical protein